MAFSVVMRADSAIADGVREMSDKAMPGMFAVA